MDDDSIVRFGCGCSLVGIERNPIYKGEVAYWSARFLPFFGSPMCGTEMEVRNSLDGESLRQEESELVGNDARYHFIDCPRDFEIRWS